MPTDYATLTELAILAFTILPSFVWLIGATLWASRRKTNNQVQGAVAVVLSARNEADSIEAAIQSIAKCITGTLDVEIIIVDDHSTDNTASIVNKLAQADSRIKLVRAPDDPHEHGSKKRALTSAINLSHAEFILLTDADCIVPTQWIQSIMSEFFDPKVGAVFGASMPIRNSSWIAMTHWTERLMVNISMAAAAGFNSPASACGHSIAYRRFAFEAIGGFAYPTLPYGDDDLTVQAIAKSGWKVCFLSNSESVVSDMRIPSWNAKQHAAARHQSTLSFYPKQWRVLYAASVAASILCILLPAAAFFNVGIAHLALLACFSKLGLDAAAALMVSRRLDIGLTVIESMVAALVLPLIALLRIMALLMPTFQWKSSTIQRGLGRPA